MYDPQPLPDGPTPSQVHCTFGPTVNQINFLGAGELFVTAQPIESVAGRSGAKRGDCDQVVTLDSILSPELEPNHRAATDLSDAVVESEDLFRVKLDPLLIE